MDKEKIKQFITSQREAGIPDEQIHAFLLEKGAIQPAQPPKATEKTILQKIGGVAEKVADFTGGKELAQGVGQALAMGETSKQIEETQKQQFDLQWQLLAKIKENKQLGKDTSRLESALADLNEEIKTTGEGAGKLLNPNELTTKQVVGDALQLATTAGAGKLAGTITEGLGGAGAAGIGAGALQGLKTGAATGAALGASTGVSQGLQDNLSAGDIAKEGVRGAVYGGVTGGALGTVTGAVSGGVRARKVRKAQEYLDAITPDTKDISPTDYEKLVTQGRISEKTSTGTAQYILTPEEKATAFKYKDVLGRDPVKNSIKLTEEIAKQDTKVGEFLRKNNGIFNKGELRNALKENMKDITDIALPENRVAKLKDNVIKNFVDGLDKNDMETLWTNRKAFDKKIEKAFTGSPTLQNEVKKALRTSVQDFIAERTPDDVYKASMKEMSQLFRLRDTALTKAIKERGSTGIQAWIKKNPTKAKTAAFVAGSGILGTIGVSVLTD
jgi:hypothetical protein